ncbi:hypothetical protein KP509_19G032500 [Ceratopteris richardii]|uniref:Uncharacterized protein n=1 Tax=Ceratopteris richardii TaxID=49495 RepID=A0A8T2SIZ8_CERRI|nr:hypothetical protein KP509_19G032500 [Ceratopteris richardii]
MGQNFWARSCGMLSSAPCEVGLAAPICGGERVELHRAPLSELCQDLCFTVFSLLIGPLFSKLLCLKGFRGLSILLPPSNFPSNSWCRHTEVLFSTCIGLGIAALRSSCDE